MHFPPASAGVIPIKDMVQSVSATFPRLRGGNPMQRSDLTVYEKLFPAHAGVILTAPPAQARSSTFPRPRGGDPAHQYTSKGSVPFSPPTRG